MCLVDDAQWLDTAVGAGARVRSAPPACRIGGAGLRGSRAERDALSSPDFPSCQFEGLRDDDARALLDSAVRGRLDARVRDRILAEAHGNPLALLELPGGLTPAQLAGGFGLPDAMPLSSRIEQGFVRRLQLAAVRDTQRLLLTAAVEPVGDANVLWRAAERLGIEPAIGGSGGVGRT